MADAGDGSGADACGAGDVVAGFAVGVEAEDFGFLGVGDAWDGVLRFRASCPVSAGVIVPGVRHTGEDPARGLVRGEAMALERRGEEEDTMSIIRGAFGSSAVTITPGAAKPGRDVVVVKGTVQPNTIFFAVDTPVYEGDKLEWNDPRGDREVAYATQVKVYNQGSASVRHIEVRYSSTAPERGATGSHGGTVINVHGSQNVNIGLGGSTVTQQMSVAPGYEKLANAVSEALAVIERTGGVDPDEVDDARESATLVVQEVAKAAPDEKAIKRALTVVKGVLTSAANAGAGAAASGLIGQLFLGA